MSIQELVLRRSTITRLALLGVGILVFKFAPSTQVSAVGETTTIRFAWAWSLTLAGVAGWAGMTSLIRAFKKDPEESRWQLIAFGSLLIGLIVYLLPGALLSKLTIDPQQISFEDKRTWDSKFATLALANVERIEVRTTSAREPFHWKRRPAIRSYLLVYYFDGSTKSAVDFGLLEPYGIEALLKLSKKLGFTITDARKS
jgi:hypothetical protein